jgi:hypothetical protein
MALRFRECESISWYNPGSFRRSCTMKHLGFALVLLWPISVLAQEATDLAVRQKATAMNHWKSLEIRDSSSPVETAHFLVFGRLSESALKKSAQQFEAAYATANKALKFTDKEGPWPGKLAVYLLSTRNDFVRLLRIAARRAAESDETSYAGISGDEAMIIVGPARVGTIEPELSARDEIIGLMLRQKFGASPPTWLKVGFVRATVARMNRPSGKVVSAPTVTFADLWNERLPEASRYQSATFYIDYWAYGPGSDWFDRFLPALRPNENGNAPSVNEIAKSLNWDERSLDLVPRSWKKPPTTTPQNKPKKGY